MICRRHSDLFFIRNRNDVCAMPIAGARMIYSLLYHTPFSVLRKSFYAYCTKKDTPHKCRIKTLSLMRHVPFQIIDYLRILTFFTVLHAE